MATCGANAPASGETWYREGGAAPVAHGEELTMKSAANHQIRPQTGHDLVTEIEAIRARIAERNPDMTEDDWDALAELWAEAINERIRRRVERMRQGQPS